MEPEPQLIATPPPVIPITPEPQRQLIAPVWNTIALLALVLGNSYVGATHMPTMQDGPIPEKAVMIGYGITIAFEFFLLWLAWFGLRRKGLKLRELIGGRWETVEDFLLDFAIGVVFYIVSYILLLALGYWMGLGGASQIKEAKKMIDMLGPQSGLSMAAFVLLSVTAGLVEEILFRGYLQRQIGAITGNIYAGLVGSAVLFGLAHGYEGARRMVLIGVLGAMFGLLALWRKSLRPGMMGHALFDSLQGVLLWMLKKGVIPLR
jgi:membrane protease YdiL (CAAX protease family)